MLKLYWKIRVFASGNPKPNIRIVTPWDIRTYGDSESDNLWAAAALPTSPAGTPARDSESPVNPLTRPFNAFTRARASKPSRYATCATRNTNI